MTPPRIHPTAVVEPGAQLAPDVVVGPYAVIGAEVRVGRGTVIAPHAVLEGLVAVGDDCVIGHGAVVGAAPQDRTYRGARTAVVIGPRAHLREYVTVHRATMLDRPTTVGDGCLLMAYVHVAHDCHVGEGVTLANAVQLAGHVTIGRYATIGGLTPVHQFVRIGEYAMIGGGSRVPQDIPPFTRAAGDPLRLAGVNRVALERAGMPAAEQRALHHAYRLLFNSSRPRSVAIAALAEEKSPPVRTLVDFVGASRRGVLAS